MTALIASIAGIISSILAIVLIYINKKNKKQELIVKETESAQKQFKDGLSSGDESSVRRALDKLRRMRSK